MRSESISVTTASDDPTRKYCLGKFVEMLVPIFLKYPYVPSESEQGAGGAVVEKSSEELSDEERARLEESAKIYADELEQCLYDTYSESDKKGRRSAGSKYKYVLEARLSCMKMAAAADDTSILCLSAGTAFA